MRLTQDSECSFIIVDLMPDLEHGLKKSSHPNSLHFEVPFTLQLLTMSEMNSLRRKTWCTLHVSDISAIQCILRLESLMTYATYKHFILHNKSLDFILSLPKLSLPEAQPKVKKNPILVISSDLITTFSHCKKRKLLYHQCIQTYYIYVVRLER